MDKCPVCLDLHEKHSKALVKAQTKRDELGAYQAEMRRSIDPGGKPVPIVNDGMGSVSTQGAGRLEAELEELDEVAKAAWDAFVEHKGSHPS